MGAVLEDAHRMKSRGELQGAVERFAWVSRHGDEKQSVAAQYEVGLTYRDCARWEECIAALNVSKVLNAYPAALRNIINCMVFKNGNITKVVSFYRQIMQEIQVGVIRGTAQWQQKEALNYAYFTALAGQYEQAWDILQSANMSLGDVRIVFFGNVVRAIVEYQLGHTKEASIAASTALAAAAKDPLGVHTLMAYHNLVHLFDWYLLGDKSSAQCFADRFGTKHRLTPSQMHMPLGFIFPTEREAMLCADKLLPNAVWIVKPTAGAGGKGVTLTSNVTGLEPNTEPEASYVVQRYIHSPLLINGRKFKLRLYVVVTSIAPLRVFLNSDGLIIFNNEQYDSDDISNLDAHVLSSNRLGRDPGNAHTWSMSQFKQNLGQDARDKFDICWDAIRRLGLITILSIGSELEKHAAESHIFGERHQNPHLFAPVILSLDVLVDEAFDPWLLEVNPGKRLHPDPDPTT